MAVNVTNTVKRLIDNFQEATGVPLVFQWDISAHSWRLQCTECMRSHDAPPIANSGMMVRWVRDIFMEHKSCSSELLTEDVERELLGHTYRRRERTWAAWPPDEPVAPPPEPVKPKPSTLSPFTQKAKRRITL